MLHWIIRGVGILAQTKRNSEFNAGRFESLGRRIDSGLHLARHRELPVPGTGVGVAAFAVTTVLALGPGMRPSEDAEAVRSQALAVRINEAETKAAAEARCQRKLRGGQALMIARVDRPWAKSAIRQGRPGCHLPDFGGRGYIITTTKGWPLDSAL